MEARIARLETDVAHLQTDVAGIKVELRTLRDKMDARLERIETKLDSLKDAVVRRKPLEQPSSGAVVTDLLAFRVLAFVIYFVCTAAIFGGLAHGFGWI